MVADQSTVYKAINTDEVEEEHYEGKFGHRHLQCVLYFIMLLTAFGFRICLAVAIVAMTDPTASINPDVPTYPHWTQKGAILSAFFWGYIWPQVLAGYMSNRFGAKWIMISAIGTQSVIGFFTPVTVGYFGEIGLMVSRAVQGFCQGCLLPSVMHLLSQWAPHEERARMTSYTYIAVPCSTVLAMYITGPISASFYGWPMVFYLYGTLGLISVILFALFGYNSPADHPRISKAEKYYIQKSLGHTDGKKSHNVPWKAIATSVPFWALFVMQCGAVFGFWAVLNLIPSYMKSVLQFNIKDNALYSALPYLVQVVLNIPVSFLSDWIINKKLVSQTILRKLFNIIGTLIPCIALAMMGYTDSHEVPKAICLITVAIATTVFASCGWGLNHLDLSPNFAGTLMGITNGFSNIFGAMAPLSVQFLVKDETAVSQWRHVFNLTVGIQAVGCVIFTVFGSAKMQHWNFDNEEEAKNYSHTEEN